MPPRGPCRLLAIQLAPQIEEADRPARDLHRERRRVGDDLGHLRQVLLEGGAGSFVNHFGGSPSAASPVSALRPSETRVVAKNCGTSVRLAIP